MEPLSATDIAACLKILARVAEDPADPILSEVRQAVDHAYRAGKKHRKATRRDERREHDHAVVATARRFTDEIPSPDAPAADRFTSGLRGGRRCYVCKDSYRDLDSEYHMLCPSCAAENAERRYARCDLTGRRAVVTGGRIKIGFHTALKLLRDGAEVLVTTRFPNDAARRFAAVSDASDWLDRLWIHGVDFIDLPGVLGLVDAVRERWGQLDILVNNAAQTIARPVEYHREVRAAERAPLMGLPASVTVTGGPGGDQTRAVAVRSALELFPATLRDETGEPLDLRDTNSWTLRVGEVSPREWLEVHVINGFVPFLLTGQLRDLLVESKHPDRYVVQVSAMEGSFSRAAKTARHPHTNMAKAGLNMLTRTVAAEYAADGIYMCSVDTGWVTDERPHPSKQAERAAGFRPPLDVIDGAARVYDPIVRGVRGEPAYGVFLKDYREVAW
ncbi:SDR family NAD(P)-dependent oxidoreductase [Luedemannella flava]|uniref:SDR family NAD(P)-dependent oxidoreductase n=1 Tax=Luedemannella flava TaxID=349316 RepID=A0ABN2LD59_9ACTN